MKQIIKTILKSFSAVPNIIDIFLALAGEGSYPVQPVENNQLLVV
jgi:hypothetical protein